jgi:hypothetical protein
MRVHFPHFPRHIEFVHAHETPIGAIRGMSVDVFLVPNYVTGEQWFNLGSCTKT